MVITVAAYGTFCKFSYGELNEFDHIMEEIESEKYADKTSERLKTVSEAEKKVTGD